MNTNKYLDTKKITARRKARFFRDCQQAFFVTQVENFARELAEEINEKEKLLSSVDDLTKNLFGVGLSIFRLAHGADTIETYVRNYVAWKVNCFEVFHDTGAIGDIVESIVHLVAMRKKWRTQKKNIHVTAISRTDVTINNVTFEVGHNAKVWNDASIENAMSGPFSGVIYGMISHEEIEGIINIMARDFNRGVRELCNLLYVFEDKSDFLRVMQTEVGKSATLKYRKDLNCIVTVYNEYKYRAFMNRMDNGDFPTLTEYMESLGENDWLTDGRG